MKRESRIRELKMGCVRREGRARREALRRMLGR
jgi:hypothetical protein